MLFAVRPCSVPSSCSACWRKRSRLAVEMFLAAVELEKQKIVEARGPVLLVRDGGSVYKR